ncbi:MAG TPA: HAD family acid phosphatase [Xanthobacteraceae bacterium]|nr:HAD family acid phosphatase [Xanthobacteraceae bacterium]
MGHQEIGTAGWRRYIRYAAVAAFIALAGTTQALGAIDCPDKEKPVQLESTQPLNLGELKLQLLNYKCFNHYAADVAQALATAMSYVEQRAGQVVRPALVLDIDETSLSNWPEIAQNDFGFIADGPCDLAGTWACGDRAWELSTRAEAIGPTLDLFNLAKRRNVAIFFISGRGDDPEKRAATEANLRNVGYVGWSGLILRPLVSSGPVAPYKSTARAAIEADGYTIIANVGDQQSDLDGGYAERTFRVPNPFYFIP